ncbi:MAG: hypothetical protein KBA26_12115 [Candidatus Delongbacteria bacterium]|nr:hypothetical protein [Candidatus Delongbacteria bacterium]
MNLINTYPIPLFVQRSNLRLPSLPGKSCENQAQSRYGIEPSSPALSPITKIAALQILSRQQKE